MRVALLQSNASDEPARNLPVMLGSIERAAQGGAALWFSPEVSNCVSADRAHQGRVLRHETEDASLAALCRAAAEHRICLLIGSLALKGEGPDPRFVNRSFAIGADGRIIARYDKIHMFDVAIDARETYTESSGYRPGSAAVLARMDAVTIGMSICYDLRFAHLFRALAQAGAQILAVPSAFSSATGPDHWETLLRARAIETGCFVIAAAQTGHHPAGAGRARRISHGHSLVVDPWGRVLLDAGEAPGLHFANLDLDLVAETRRRLPALSHDRAFAPPSIGD
ncbi:carbon-nitrogen hydrolase family protein [Profundibacterium mesophilum]|uniref:Nitrilase n=1 Tax=Profundibacterium mesophilum KAUST100406-0324 TaxID=1037889 RepID=A0A921NVF3_9RHOB|nr:carbon-nitrogen hydrolase family protein [Profundibacterium mesophilum]KAF0676353.1 nitrilase [Profundibacterium mesophilum KAUST100406-0324]